MNAMSYQTQSTEHGFEGLALTQVCLADAEAFAFFNDTQQVVWTTAFSSRVLIWDLRGDIAAGRHVDTLNIYT